MHYIRMVILCLGLSVSLVNAQGDLEKLESLINTDQYDETTPVLSKTGDKLFFTRTADPGFEPTLFDESGHMTVDKENILYMDRLALVYSQIAGTTISNPTSSVYNQDIWFASLSEDGFQDVIHPGYPVNNALPNSLVSTGMSPDEYVLLNQFYEDGSMYAGFSRVHIGNDGKYLFPSPMHIYQFDLTSSDVNMTMTPDGHVLVLSMKRSDSKGVNDLYASFYVRDNVWSAPIHMGYSLNTIFQETSPHISPDKRFIYFSSNRPGGVGGNDIYVSERLDYSWLRWSEPVQVKGNVNSVFDDSQPYFDPEANYMYFTSRRDGSSDIFRQRLTPKPKLKKPVFVRGKILNVVTGQPVHSELFWGQQSSVDYLEYFNTYTGEFEVSLTEYEPYKFKPRKANHISQRILVDPRGLEKQGIDTFDLVLYVEPKETNINAAPESGKRGARNQWYAQNRDPRPEETLTFYDINFVKGKSIILGKSKGALKYLERLMKDHPDMEIMIEGHTDNIGDEAALIELSLQRADAIRKYLVHQGIEEQRMQISGMGATKPQFQNFTESQREKNRRVEISILKQ